MKLHLPLALSRALFACFATLALTQISSGATSESYPNGSITFTTRQTEPLTLEGYETILFEEIDDLLFEDSYPYIGGGAIYNDYDSTFTLSDNGNITFIKNTSEVVYGGGAIENSGTFMLSDNGNITFKENTSGINGGGAIYNYGDFTLSGNESVIFSENFASNYSFGGAIENSGTFTLSGNAAVSFSGNFGSLSGGAIYNDYDSTFTLRGNGDVTFSGNSTGYSSPYGGAICNENGTFELSGNGNVTFSGNSASDSFDNYSLDSYGGAICNENGTFTLSGNGDVTFSGNTASSSSDAYGGAIYNRGTFTLSDNGDVLFEKNAEVRNGIYRLRSIYSDGGTLNLSASEGKSILFKDSVYASGTVNLNQGGKGDIIFSGATTEADLREVKGGIDGTAEEILNSRTSEIATMANLYGGRLIVEDGAILKGRGITAMADSGATIRLNNGTLDHSGYALTFNAGTSFEAEGVNTVTAGSVNLLSGSTLSFVLGEENLTAAAMTLTGNLNTGAINLSIGGSYDLKAGHTYALLTASDYDTSAWTSDNVTLTTGGLSFDNLSWHDGTLYLNYSPYPNGSITFTTRQAKPLSLQGYASVCFTSINGSYEIDSNATFPLSGNGNGAIYNGSVSSVSDSGNVTFRDNYIGGSTDMAADYYQHSRCGVIFNGGSFGLNYNESVTFENNSVRNNFFSSINISDIEIGAYGGAIYNAANSGFWLRNNKVVTFSGNSAESIFDWSAGFNYFPSEHAHAYGGAIFNDADFRLRNNGNVTFSGNSARSSGGEGFGGAIYNHTNATFELTYNNSVTFIGNYVFGGGADEWRSGCGSARGGAICNVGSTFMLSNNGDVNFSENSADASSGDDHNSGWSNYSYGGAIYNYRGTFELSDNGDISFSGNSSTASDVSGGGAIYNDWFYDDDYSVSTLFLLSSNGNVTFSGNSSTASGRSYGGAIYNSMSTFELSGNGDVTFSGNSVTSYDSCGGAIYNSGTFTLSDNGAVTFSGNTASSSISAYGGAIWGGFTLSGNGNVTFSGNTASSSSSYAYGGAIYGDFTLSGNGDVTFSGNTASSSSSDAYGGAIFNNKGTFELSGNGDVLFEKNAEISNGTYRLRSIYSNGGTLNLSASEGKSILFKDSVYASGTVNLNQDGKGDIIFSGATTEFDLCEVKGGVDGTVRELHDSRVSQLLNDVTLRGGSLQVQDNAILVARQLSIGTASQNATLCLHDGFVDVAESLSLSSGSTLVLTGVNTLLSSSVNSAGNNTISLTLEEEHRNTAALTVGGSLQNGTALHIDLGDVSRLQGNNYCVLHRLGDADGWESAIVSLSGASDNALTWVNGDLYLNYNAATLPSLVRRDVTLNGNELTIAEGYGALSVSGRVHNSESYIAVIDNASVSFSGNSVSSSSSGGAIYNAGTFTLSGNGAVTFSENSSRSGGAIYNRPDASFTLSGNGAVTFSENTASSGGAIYNDRYTFTLSNNGNVTFSGNTVSSYGGAIYNAGTFTLSGNGAVTFSENTASSGGAIYNSSDASFTISGNGAVTFSGNSASYGGAIYNDYHASFTLSNNGNVTFSGNTGSSSGSAIYNGDRCTFTLRGNGDVTFSGNSSSSGRVIYNYKGTFELSGNGDVLFEKNAEVRNGIYRLRSIYSAGTLNLSASEGKSILFKDSVYASGTVNLNQDGTGDIVFTGVSTEADLREVKGGVDGTAEEILNSRTSEIATNASLYGGRLIVEDGAILKGRGITVTEGANATIRLNGGTLNETGYTIAVSSGSGLEFEGENTLAASAVSLADNSFLSFILDEAQTAVNWDANLDIQGGLTLNLTHADKPAHETYALLAMQSGNTVTGWDVANLSISGASAEHLAWENNTLYYRPMLVQENGDTTLDKDVDTDAAGGTIGGKDDVTIDGNGHTLTVKNAVQLVQMALKDGTVKLEGENNGIVSVTLTEGGELVLTAGAGLTTGDIISMVASGKGELVISGDITLDDKGMKGKDGNLATVSHADMKVLGDASISNVRVEDSTIDLLEGSTVNFTNVVLAAGTRITDDPATANMDCVVAELAMGVNTWQTGSGAELTEGTVLTQTGNTGEALTLTGDSPVLMLEATTFDSLTLTGTTLTLSLSGMTREEFDAAPIIGISFTSGKDYAVFDSSLAVLLTLDGGITFTPGYTLGSDGTTVYFCGANAPVVPEPATVTLSLLALAALAARRKRKA